MPYSAILPQKEPFEFEVSAVLFMLIYDERKTH